MNIIHRCAAPAQRKLYTTGSAHGWMWEGTLMYKLASPIITQKLACFDFDGSLVHTSVRKRGPDAWSILYPGIPKALFKLQEEGYTLVIFSNQADIGKTVKAEARERAILEKQGRFLGFLEHCMNLHPTLSIHILVATGYNGRKKKDEEFSVDIYRKPQPGMFDFLVSKMGSPPDLSSSFFVGDAAGRPNDHSDCDLKFAETVGLSFHLPEDFFKE
eukprot:TRINITY_DN533_c1_g2_i3.p1 TRINITY_DN533_c1_g2~~TRINITY_DN533_c1_g2_i3.p1  ORF type:complete len:216 (-),score=38.55 TRINITY_DN533_c1_g2_i3:1032-1679(-)